MNGKSLLSNFFSIFSIRIFFLLLFLICLNRIKYEFIMKMKEMKIIGCKIKRRDGMAKWAAAEELFSNEPPNGLLAYRALCVCDRAYASSIPSSLASSLHQFIFSPSAVITLNLIHITYFSIIYQAFGVGLGCIRTSSRNMVCVNMKFQIYLISCIQL